MLEVHKGDASPTQIAASLERDGGTIVEDFVSPKCVDALQRDFAPHLEAQDWGDDGHGNRSEFGGYQTKRLHGLLARSPQFESIVVHPLLAALCDRFLKPHSHDYRVSTGELMAIGAGQANQRLHRDADSWYHVPRPRSELLVSANVALTDFTVDNGATRVVPGSHRWPAERRALESEVVDVVMRRGSALLYGGDILHGGGSNRTDQVRIGLYIGFIVSWLRPIENHLVTNGETVLRSASPAVRRLLDFTEHGWTPLA